MKSETGRRRTYKNAVTTYFIKKFFRSHEKQHPMCWSKYYATDIWENKRKTCSLLGNTELIPEEKLVKKWEELGLTS